MDLRRILRIKKIEEKERARKIKEIESVIESLERERSKYEEELRRCQERITGAEDVLRLIFRQKAFVSRINEIERKVRELERLKDQETENLKEVKREEKAVNLLRDKASYEEYARSLRREFLQLGLIHIIRKGLKVLLVLSLVAFGQSAVQEKLRDMEMEKREERLKEVERIIEEKLRRLVEERKKLEALRRRPLTEEEEREVQKLIRIVSKTPSDEAGAILNEVNPRIAAEILLRLKDRQAGQILAAMDPKKAAEVTEIIMSWRKNAKKR
jgi:flagellar motility protein MotE (MotC chaperone)